MAVVLETPTILRVCILVVGTIFFFFIFRRALLNPRSHGFYRFFAFESCLILVGLNIPRWFKDPFVLRQIFSWLLLAGSILAVLLGAATLKRFGGKRGRENSPATYRFEETSALVEEGVYRWIRHPMYSSLLLGSWGVFLKGISIASALAALIATTAVIVTAKIEEGENLKAFGPAYREYMKTTKMFVPFLF